MKAENSQQCDVRAKVLVIDDSPEVHRLLRARLRHEDLELLEATSREAGIELAASRSPTLILLDLDMGGVDGYETLRNVREAGATRNTPVIVLSSRATPQDKVTAFELGAVDFIAKPIEMAEARVRIRSAVRTTRLMLMLSAQARLDGLTGLWNRFYFDDRWAEECSRAQRHRRSLSLAILDADHFKSINDTFGHPAGDAVLQQIGAIVRREARLSDIPCRYGGEEFAVIMPDTSATDSCVLVERIRAAVQEVVWPRHPERRVTISAGVTTVVPLPEIAPSKWIEAADQNLYRAKQSGRNRLVADEAALLKAA